jgi:tetratricopeptide (TPR) repeat protein
MLRIHAYDANCRPEAGELEFALLALQRAADCNGALQSLRPGMPEDDANACARLEAEYFILRTALVSETNLCLCRLPLTPCKSWKEGRLDVAEHMYGKSESLRQTLDPNTAETLTDTLFEIGNDLLKKNDFIMAVKWLERAYELLNSQELEQLSREAIELRLAISQSLVQALLGINTTESFQKAESHVGYIESELGDKFVVLLLRLEILLKSPSEVFDSNAYASILQRMIRALDLSDSNFRLIIHHLRKLDDKAPALARHILDDFLIDKVIPSQRDEWIERTVIVRAYTSCNRRDTQDTVGKLGSLFDRISGRMERSFAVDSAMAILTVRKLDSLWSRKTKNRVRFSRRRSIRISLRGTWTCVKHGAVLRYIRY